MGDAYFRACRGNEVEDDFSPLLIHWNQARNYQLARFDRAIYHGVWISIVRMM